MLPGFRFVLAAMMLSVSILVFGLGAAALLRAAHEEVASNPSWHAAPEAMFAPPGDARRPVLALPRVEPSPAEPKAPADLPAVAEPVQEVIAPTPAEQVGIPSPSTEAKEIAALKTDEAAPPEAARTDMPAVKSPTSTAVAPAQTDAAVAADEPRIATSNSAETTRIAEPAAKTKVVPTEQVAAEPAAAPLAAEAAVVAPAPAATERKSTAVSPQPEAASTRIATLGSPPDATEKPAKAKASSEKPDSSVIKKRQQARRAAHRRRMAARARQARLAAQQSSASPFTQPFVQPPAPTRTR